MAQMTVYAAKNLNTEVTAEVEPVAAGIGRTTCLECAGKPEEYPSLFPPEMG